MTAAIIATTLLCSCGMGERMLSNCTATHSALCWPCDAGFACDGSETSVQCFEGKEWSARGAHQCTACSQHCPSAGMMRVLSCSATSDQVCAACPAGYGCVDDEAVLCAMNTHSNGNGTCVACPANTSSLAGATECTASACAPHEFMTADRGCQACPAGFECSAQGVARPCKADWYSSGGKCVECDPNAVAPERSSSADHCVCVPGYVKTPPAHKCSPCQSGTVWRNGACVLCDAGHYCVGRTHRDVCPIDTYSTRGSAQCMDCRPFSGCAKPLCTEAYNCTCDPGYIDYRGACLRCAAGTSKENNTCVQCAPGFECLGGADVHRCGLGTYANGSASKCSDCTDCREVLVARCNQTHDSVCARTTVPLAVVTILQDFRTEVDGEIFTMFAMILASTLPKARLLHICGGATCIQCFQGVCPVQRMKRQLNGPLYRTAIESRFNANKLYQNLEGLTQSNFLYRTAEATMRKLTDLPLTASERIEHEVLCPEDMVWDARMGVCFRPSDASRSGSPRTWLGLLFGIAILAGVGVYGGRDKIRNRLGWVRVQEVGGVN